MLELGETLVVSTFLNDFVIKNSNTVLFHLISAHAIEFYQPPAARKISQVSISTSAAETIPPKVPVKPVNSSPLPEAPPFNQQSSDNANQSDDFLNNQR